MIPARVQDLRRELESTQFKGTRQFMERLADEHRKLVGIAPTSCRVSITGVPLLTGFERVVIGSHGPYIEFKEAQCLIPLNVKEGQGWRTEPSDNHPKYIWLYPRGFPSVKIYKQLRPVAYASYVVGMLYVDLWAVELTGES